MRPGRRRSNDWEPSHDSDTTKSQKNDDGGVNIRQGRSVMPAVFAAVPSVQCSSDETNNSQKYNNRNAIVSKTPSIVGMRRAKRGNGMIAAAMSARGSSGDTNNSDGNSSKDPLPSSLTPRITMGEEIHPKSNKGARRSNSLMAAMMSVRDIANNSDGNSSKEFLPSSLTPRRLNGSAKMSGRQLLRTKKPSIQRSTSQRTRRMNSAINQIHQLTSLVSFMKNNRSERVNLLQTAMAPFEVC